MLDREALLGLLEDLAGELSSVGVRGEMFVLGGGAMALASDPGLAVSIASPRYLLAMKVMAARIERDEDDIVTLAGLTGMESDEAILDRVETTYPGQAIPLRVQYFLEKLFAR